MEAIVAWTSEFVILICPSRVDPVLFYMFGEYKPKRVVVSVVYTSPIAAVHRIGDVISAFISKIS